MSLTEAGRRALILRKQTSKTSYTKLDRIRDIVSSDGRLRDQFSFLGSSRAGRWSGHGVQIHNLPRPTKAVEQNLSGALALLEAGNSAAVEKELGFPLEVVAGCLRSMFQAPPGYKLIVSDLNAIENRGLGWVARCDAILDVFRKNRCPYLDFSTKLHGESYEELETAYKAGDALAKQRRQDSKPPVLGAGYRLGGGEEIETEDGDIIRTGLWGYAQNMGIELSREQAHNAVKVFREAYPEVKQLWYDLEDAAFRAMKDNTSQERGRCVFQAFGPKKARKLLRILLPSGRGLHYIRPKLEMREFMGQDKLTLTYEGIDQKKHIWTRIQTQGGKLTENIVQAISRDILLNGMFLAEQRGLTIVGHIHDEIITLVPESSPLGLADLRTCMIESPTWAADFPLNADGFEDKTYRKG